MYKRQKKKIVFISDLEEYFMSKDLFDISESVWWYLKLMWYRGDKSFIKLAVPELNTKSETKLRI